jgi:hypothetical protein
MIAKLGKWSREQTPICMALLCALFALTDVCLQPALAARALPAAAEPENDSKEGEKASDKGSCTQRSRHARQQHPFDHLDLSALIARGPGHDRQSFGPSRPNADRDLFGTGISTRLRC